MYKVEILADSLAEHHHSSGVRLITVAATYPRIVLAEANTHRSLSRNTASSRAIPVETRCSAIEASPFVPVAFSKNKRGMQADEVLGDEDNMAAEAIWRSALADSLRHARALAKLGVHKQYANRLTEPFAWVTQIITATEWDNFFALRTHADAQPEIQEIAVMMLEAIRSHTPVLLYPGQWHLPLVSSDEASQASEISLWPVKLSVARCAAVSYEKHDVKKSRDDELARHDLMLGVGHMSPFEHQACALHPSRTVWSGNFRGPWQQYRKTIKDEYLFGGKRML